MLCTGVWGQIQVSQKESALAHNGELVQLSCSCKGLNTAPGGSGSSPQLHVKMTHSNSEYQTFFDVFPDMRNSPGEEGTLDAASVGGAQRTWTHLAPLRSSRRNPGWVITLGLSREAKRPFICLPPSPPAPASSLSLPPHPYPPPLQL